MADSITIARARSTDDTSCALIAALNAELGRGYAEPRPNHFHLDPEEAADGRGAFLARRLDAETAELKRKYVTPALRHRPEAR